jgi:hypothetical protein
LRVGQYSEDMPAGALGADDDLTELYRGSALALEAAQVPFLVGGAFALAHYTPVTRDTKDFDLFVRPADVPRALEALRGVGFETDVPFPHWLAKAYFGETFIDIIFCSGNGVAVVDDEWFDNAPLGNVLGLPMPLCPAEEMLWSKAFVLERERYDGADVLHLIHEQGPDLDWPRLLRRFGVHWRVLYAHLILFGFVYPGEDDAIPAWVMKTLADKLAQPPSISEGTPVCRGTLLSREQYLIDVEQIGYRDARLDNPDVHMTANDIARWTEAIPGRRPSNARSQDRRHR